MISLGDIVLIRDRVAGRVTRVTGSEGSWDIDYQILGRGPGRWKQEQDGGQVQNLTAEERRAYANRPTSELRTVELALSLHTFVNTPRETARLAVVKELLCSR